MMGESIRRKRDSWSGGVIGHVERREGYESGK